VGDLLALYRQLEARVQADETLAAAPHSGAEFHAPGITLPHTSRYTVLLLTTSAEDTEAEHLTREEGEGQGIVNTMLSQELLVLSNAAAGSRRLKAARFFPTHPFYSPQRQELAEYVLFLLTQIVFT
jgi:hypothetical protein